MRRIRFLLFGLGVILSSACSRESIVPGAGEEVMGEVEILLSHDSAFQTKVETESSIPEVDSLKVEIFKITPSGLVRLYRDKYANAVGRKIPLNCADYRLLASHGDSLAAGFDRPYFAGTSDFTLSRQESQIVETVVKVSNVRVGVKFGENLSYDYPEFYASVKSVTAGGRTKSLKFYHDEQRKGFVPLGDVSLELYAKVDGEWKYYPSLPVKARPGDDITFSVDTRRLESETVFNVTIEQPDQQPKSYTLSQDMYPVDSPEVGGDEFSGTMVVTKGDQPLSDLKLDIVAEGSIEKCILSIGSEYLSKAGVPSEVDLASDTLDPAVKSTLEGVGIRWMSGMKGRRFAYVDFSGVTRFLAESQCDPDNMFKAVFAVKVEDARGVSGDSEHVGEVATDSMTFIQGIPSPEIHVSGFPGESVKVMEAVVSSHDDMKVSLEANGRIARCLLHIDSPYMQAAGIPETVDLASADSDMISALNAFGITWSDTMSGCVNAGIDFSGVPAYMEGAMYEASKGTDFARFSVSLENEEYMDDKFKETRTYVGALEFIIPSSPSAEDNFNVADVWARRIKGYKTVLNEGNLNEWKLQYSTDGSSWHDMPAEVDGNTLICRRLNGLQTGVQSGVEHSVRAVYHNNPDIVYALSAFTTEAAAQLPDAGFENWQIADYEYYLDKVNFAGGGYYTSRKWYRPWDADEEKGIWDVNSCKTMPSNTTPKEQDYKVFPAVSYSVDTPSGTGSSAQMVGVYVCNMATSGSNGDGGLGSLGGLIGGVSKASYKAAGEIFIGTADESGNHSAEGCTFHSRPDRLRFAYKYAPVNSETYQVSVRVKDAQGRVIAEGGLSEGQASSGWTHAEVPLVYHLTDAKAADIYMSFRSASCADSDIDYNLNVTLEMAGSNFKGHLGSVLKVDDVELIYE